MQRKKANNAEKKWPAFRDNFSKGWQLLSFPWNKRHLFQLILTAGGGHTEGSSCYKERTRSAPSQNIIIKHIAKKTN
jgi:hypothetical protein